jgi:hypothetical protein
MSPTAAMTLLSLLLVPVAPAEPERGLTVSDARTIAEGGSVARPSAAFGQCVYLVVWRRGWPGVGGAADIVALRLEPATLRRRDHEPIGVCTADEAQDAPQVAFHGGAFLVVWQDFRNGRDFDIVGSLVDADTGHLIRKEIFVATGDSNQVFPAVAAIHDGFLVVWQDWRGEGQYGVSSRRVSLAGELLGPQAEDITDLGARPAIARSADNLLITWVTGARRGVTSAALLRAKDGAVVQDLKTIIACCPREASVAGDGRGNFWAVSARTPYPDPWGWGGPGAVVCARVRAGGEVPDGQAKYNSSQLSERKVPNVVDAASWGDQPNGPWRAGAVGGFPGTHDGLWPRGLPTLAFAGEGLYLFAWVKGKISQDRLTLGQYDVWLRGMDHDSLQVRWPDRKLVGNESTDETRPALIAGPKGEVLLLYEQIPVEGPCRIVAHRLVWGPPADTRQPR